MKEPSRRLTLSHFNQISGGELPGQVTYGEIFAVQPFGNNLVTMTLTGDQLERVLEQQWGPGTRQVILQISDSLRYTWDASAPIGVSPDFRRRP